MKLQRSARITVIGLSENHVLSSVCPFGMDRHGREADLPRRFSEPRQGLRGLRAASEPDGLVVRVRRNRGARVRRAQRCRRRSGGRTAQDRVRRRQADLPADALRAPDRRGRQAGRQQDHERRRRQRRAVPHARLLAAERAAQRNASEQRVAGHSGPARDVALHLARKRQPRQRIARRIRLDAAHGRLRIAVQDRGGASPGRRSAAARRDGDPRHARAHGPCTRRRDVLEASQHAGLDDGGHRERAADDHARAALEQPSRADDRRHRRPAVSRAARRARAVPVHVRGGAGGVSAC